MGCGLVATAAGISKMVYTSRTAHLIDFFYDGVPVTIFTYVFSGTVSALANNQIEKWSSSSA
jgi:hypothetical protein